MVPPPEQDSASPSRPAQRWLPAAWRGPSRRAAWQRRRARRVLTAALAALAMVLALGALRPAPDQAGVPVLVASHDLAAGSRLAAADVEVAEWPARVPAPATADSAGAVVGQTVNAPVAAGEPLPDARLRGAGLLAHLPTDRVAVHVPLRDPAIRAYLRPGDRVDALSALDGETVAADLLVLARSVDGGSGVLVAATSAQAGSLARTVAEDGPGGGVVLTIRAPG